MPISREKFNSYEESVEYAQSRIYDFLKDSHDTAYTRDEIQQNLKIKEKTVEWALGEMKKNGLIENKKPYWIVKEEGDTETEKSVWTEVPVVEEISEHAVNDERISSEPHSENKLTEKIVATKKSRKEIIFDYFLKNPNTRIKGLELARELEMPISLISPYLTMLKYEDKINNASGYWFLSHATDEVQDGSKGDSGRTDKPPTRSSDDCEKCASKNTYFNIDGLLTCGSCGHMRTGKTDVKKYK